MMNPSNAVLLGVFAAIVVLGMTGASLGPMGDGLAMAVAGVAGGWLLLRAIGVASKQTARSAGRVAGDVTREFRKARHRENSSPYSD